MSTAESDHVAGGGEIISAFGWSEAIDEAAECLLSVFWPDHRNEDLIRVWCASLPPWKE
ncbi:hypothetical protein [Mesorhizobium sp. M1399]|uniref:hypothetical protein n=1 Tax=Mesorhizobium sp. M1399 TaxID=2957096 RepID=UPI00333DCFEB